MRKEFVQFQTNIDDNDLTKQPTRDGPASVDRYGGLAAIGMDQAPVRPARSCLDKAKFLERPKDLPRRQSRRCAHGMISRSRTPTKSTSADSVSSSRQRAAASAMFAIASFMVRP